MLYRIYIMILNLIFPPVAVMLLTGIGSPETVLNTCLFLLAVIPSHVHGFIVSWNHFREKDKEEKRLRRRRQRHGRSNSSYSTGSSRGRSSRRRHYSDKAATEGELEEYYSDTLYEEPVRPRYIGNRHQYAIPPPCPDPPFADDRHRYLQ